MAKRDAVPELIGEVVVTLIGLVICVGILGSVYFMGYGLAHYFGGGEHRQAFGLIAAIAIIWIYEHRIAHDRWQRFLNR